MNKQVVLNPIHILHNFKTSTTCNHLFRLISLEYLMAHPWLDLLATPLLFYGTFD